MTHLSPLSDDAFLDQLQRGAFDYFRRTIDPRNGLVADNSRDGAPVSIAVVGLALSAYPVAVERGWMTRAGAIASSLAALRFFRDSDQSGSPAATGFNGFYYHFLDHRTGARAWQSELSMMDTALLIAGALSAGGYFTGASPGETELRELADALYRRIDWRWAQDETGTVRQGWKPECGFLHYSWEGYCEALVLYVLAMGSPTHPIVGGGYKAWTLTYQWEQLYGHDHLYAGPLFVHQFSHAWIDFRGIRDGFMREKRSDYFENSRRAVLIQREYSKRNPYEFAGYDELGWGLSACDGPRDGKPDGLSGTRSLLGYAARGVPYGPDDGTLSAPAVLASLPFAPELVLPAVRNLIARYPDMYLDGRLSSGVNPTITDGNGRAWVSAGHYGLDQGIVLLMIENYRTQQIWRLMRDCPYVLNGLHRAGFRGGWLRRGKGAH